MTLGLTEITTQLHSRLIGVDVEISSVSIDSRTLQAGDLYVAIKGDNFDGHDFVKQAEEAGASALLVEHQINSLLPQLVVKNTRLALAELAHLWRQKSQATIIAVTGSNGKTTVKEMLAAILAVNADVLATKGNFNNDIGVPLSLLRLLENHRHAVIEMGANNPHEIAFSSRYALADVALINNVGAAHLQGFGSLEGVAKAKGEIITGLKAAGTAVLNKDDQFYPLWVEMAGKRKTRSFALNDVTADVYATDIASKIENAAFVTTFTLHNRAEKQAICLKLAGVHNVNNALAAACAALAINIPLSQIQQGLATVEPVTGRLQPWVSREGNIVIDDSYNANPTSLNVGLTVLKSCQGEPWLILGAFGELGENSQQIHQQMGKTIREQGVKRVFAVGDDARYSVEAFGEGALFFNSQEELINALKAELKGDEVLLIKGSRSQRMEHVAAALIDNFRK
ncbi:MAG: UDP-N-acetylmuramoyl-tripeptide--D-alanyl-D-alanine ligase [Methylococcaceae bacterium]|nr:UDP-N-acetylmuramoyl-tripeptide--D-alanyl-D-alanine ligase [Methylococcaceae bacterium]